MRSILGALCALGATALLLTVTERPVSAWQCDFLTGGGYIFMNGAKGTFGVGGGCKHDEYWGHVEYHDHGTGLNVHWTTITAYQEWSSDFDEKGRIIGRRRICGTARTNDPLYPEVNFAVVVGDAGEPGVSDQFDIQLKSAAGTTVYTTFGWDTSGGYPHKLGGGAGGGGDIQLHKPNNSTTGVFDGPCPAG
jgi:hypothetical protein